MRFAFFGALTLVALPVVALAQFQNVKATAFQTQIAANSSICDTSAFPPFNRMGPWSFSLCGAEDSVVVECAVTASPIAQEKLPPAMLRRALLRLMEEYESGNGVSPALVGALDLNCVQLEQNNS